RLRVQPVPQPASRAAGAAAGLRARTATGRTRAGSRRAAGCLSGRAVRPIASYAAARRRPPPPRRTEHSMMRSTRRRARIAASGVAALAALALTACGQPAAPGEKLVDDGKLVFSTWQLDEAGVGDFWRE